MYLTSNNIKFTSYDNTNEVVNELFEPICSIYQEKLETLMRESEFNFDAVQVMYCKCYKVDFKRSDSYIDSLYWTKNKKATI